MDLSQIAITQTSAQNQLHFDLEAYEASTLHAEKRRGVIVQHVKSAWRILCTLLSAAPELLKTVARREVR